jgi:hypothetical protein
MTAPRTKSTPVIKLGKVTKTSNITFRAVATRGSMYDDIFDQMESLKAGESFTVDVPKDVTPRTMHNRINAAMRRVDIQAPKNCVFTKRTTEDNKIAISCERA